MALYAKRSYYRRFRPPMTPVVSSHSRRAAKVRAISRQTLADENECRRDDPPLIETIEPVEIARVERPKPVRRNRSQGLILGLALLAAVAGGLFSARWNLISNQAADGAGVVVTDTQVTSQIAAEAPRADAASTLRNPVTTTPPSTATETRPRSEQAAINTQARRQTEQPEIDFVYTDDIATDTSSERTVLGILLDAVQKLEGR